MDGLRETFSTLFSFLRDTGYAWEPLAPERLQQCRRQAREHGGSYDAVTRAFGLGLPADDRELREAGLPERVLPALPGLRPAVSRVGDVLVPHHHWADAGARGDFVYLGRESLELLDRLQARERIFRGRDVLDLGSGSGALSFGLARPARRVLGLELSGAAVEWASAAASAQSIGNVRFRQARIGSAEAEGLAGEREWDAAVFNPPMAVPSCGQRPFRDGGALGIEVPLSFLGFARRHLKRGGEACFLATNPIVGGRPALFDRLDRRAWAIEERERVQGAFNRGLYRKESYAAQGIETVELWFLRLRKLG